MKTLTTISRILVGSLFIVSGLIKANDTLGFSYKLVEYFENGALAYRVRWFGWDTFSLEFLMDYALAFAILLCAIEVVLGFMVLFGTKIKLTVFSLLGLTTLFFFLTLHTATCDPFASYNELTTIQSNSAEHTQMLTRMKGNDKISIVKEAGTEIVFQEEMAVQCVNDCGCFGDAMKGSLGRSLTPWESFTKDVILMILIIPVYLSRKKIQVNTTKEDIMILSISLGCTLFFSWVFDWYFPLLFSAIGFGGYILIKKILEKRVGLSILWVTIITFIFIYFTYNHLPIRDYRAYAVGKSIPEQMVLPEGAIEAVYENIFYYKNKTTGEVEEFTETNYPWDNDNYEFSDRKTKLIQAGDIPAISDFTIQSFDDGNDYAQDFFNEEGYIFMLISHNIKKTDIASFKKINTFVEKSNANGSYFIGLTASMYNDVESFRHDQQTMFDFYTCDGVTLKTIVRANPGILLMKKGTILAKWHVNDLPAYEVVKEQYLK